MNRIRIIAVLLLLVGIAIGFFVYSSQVDSESNFKFRLGLDLSGGTLLTYRADVSDVDSADVGDAMESLHNVIERRVNIFGVSEPVVQTEISRIGEGEEHRLIVELPGVTNVDDAVKQLGQTPLLEFKLLTGDLSTIDVSDQEALDNLNIDEFYTSTGLTGRFLKRAQLQFGQGGSQGLTADPIVTLTFDNEGGDLFEDITTNNVGEVLAIFLDGIPISQPVIQGPIAGGQAVITGSFTPDEGRELARNLNFGALPVPIELIGTQTIGAALGEEILARGLGAGIWGLALVALFMIVWYRLPGLISVVSLAIYISVMLALFKLVPVTLTAAGIAGFILSLGMAVDANVLIFERLKEEINSGKDLHDAIKEGFTRAWLSIRDGNVTSVFTAIILFYTTTSLVKGFALVFGVGVLVSMITAVSVTRTFLFAIAPKNVNTLFKSGIR